MNFNNAFISFMNFGVLSGELAKPLEQYIGRPIRYLAYRALLWRAFAGVFFLLVLVSSTIPGSWSKILERAWSLTSLSSLVTTGIVVLFCACSFSWLSVVTFPAVPRSANPRYYRDTGIKTSVVDNWLGVLFQNVRLQNERNRIETIRQAIGEITQHASGDVTDDNPDTLAIIRALQDPGKKLVTEPLELAGLRITMGSVVLDGIAILMLIAMSFVFAAFLAPIGAGDT